MADTNHKLYLGMFSFQIKKERTQNTETIPINDFLSEAYPDVKNKFIEGFAEEVVSLFDQKAFKNKQNTHGGILEDKVVSSHNRYFDILIDGGLTGIKQFIVDDEGNKETITEDKIVGLKFYSRIWLPAGNKTGYVFLQRYGGLSIKPLFDEVIKSTLKRHGYNLANLNKTIKPITTKKRLDDFLKSSSIRDVTVISKTSSHETGAGDAQTVRITLRNIITKKKNQKIDKEVIEHAMKNHGFTIGDRKYEMKATYESKVEGKKEEEKTTKLDATSDTINIIPNILLPSKCIDRDGYPVFREMMKFVDDEIEQIKKESKLK